MQGKHTAAYGAYKEYHVGISHAAHKFQLGGDV
jgi:hypothetical protein